MWRNDSSPLAPGYRLDRYELLGPLAEGGMASVWVARQRGKHGFEKLVAVKTILPQYASDERFQQMFLDEARIASRIEHFNVARIIDLGEEHDVLYLVMEYVDGDSVSKLLRACTKAGTALPPGVALRILADSCSGLHEAHELRDEGGHPLEIVHRDMSPHNILVSTKGIAKVIDFGIAKARDRAGDETNAGVLKGKIQYMPPEQALGGRVDRRADVWALGATLHHLLCGKAPFDADSTLATLHMLTSGKPPAALPNDVHPAIAAVVRRALTAQPERRFQTAAEMRDAMEAAMVAARVATTAGDVGSFVVEHLSERTAKRRQTVDIALAAASERMRVEQMLRVQQDRTGSGLTEPRSYAQTVPEAPGALRGEPRAEPLATPVAADVSEAIVLPKSRAPVVVATLAVIALVTAGGAAFVKLRPHPPAPPVVVVTRPTAPPAIPTVPTAAVSAAIAASSPAAGSVAPPPSASVPSIPLFVASALPRATVVPVVAPPPRPPPKPAKGKVDDGF